MSSVFQLELTAASSPLERLALNVRAVTSDEGLVAHLGSGDTVTAVVTLESGLWVSVSRLGSFDDVPTFGKELGIDSVAAVILQLNGARDPIAQLDDMLTVVFRLLERVPGDAVLHYEEAEVWLVRRDGELIVNDDDEIWIPERLARVPPPYRRAPLVAPTD